MAIQLPDEFWSAVDAFILSHIDEGIHVIDTDGVTKVYNRKMAELEAMKPQDVIDRPISDVFRFADNEDSTLLYALRERKETRNIRQTYFNNRGRAITTVNDTYPIFVAGRVIGAVEIARDVTTMEQVLQDRLQPSLQYTFDRIIGKAPEFLDVLQQAKRAARTVSSVLIVGETGTGKELIAQSMHQAGPRAGGPFVSQNCAALPESLIEGLLFGTVRGAFTGAIDRPGLIEQASGGTLLLDELNALSPSLQAKLLRVLQERMVRRVGATKDKPIDIRVLATINEDPVDAVAANRLRKDLYYRLGVVTLFLPPLRERTDDIPILVQHFIDKYNQSFHLHVQGIDALLLEQFIHYGWPGNVRELEHAIEGAMNLIEGDSMIRLESLPFHIRRRLTQGNKTSATEYPDDDMIKQNAAEGAIRDKEMTQGSPEMTKRDRELASTPLLPSSLGRESPTRTPLTDSDGNLHTALQTYERTYIGEVLSRTEGNVSAAARALGLSRQNLQYRLRKLGLR